MRFLPTPWNHNSRKVHTIVSGGRSLYENVISSTKSTTVKKIQAVISHRKKRLGYGQTVVEGPRMVFDLLENPTTASLVQHILISVDDYEQYQERLDQLIESRNHQHPCHVQLVEPVVLKACTDTVTPQGIMALVDIPKLSPDVGREYPFFLVLDGVSDPGNVGTLLRSSLAVGASGVVMLPGCCDVWNPKAVRSSMGASFQLPIVDASDWEDAVQTLVGTYDVKKIYGATMMEGDEDSKTGGHYDLNAATITGSLAYFDIDWLLQPSALVIGSEGNGLSTEVRDAIEGRRKEADVAFSAVHVPMKAGIESLNAAVCGSVIMFEYSRQCEQQLRKE